MDNFPNDSIRKPRLPTDAEQHQLAERLAKIYDTNIEHQEAVVAASWIVVFDDYATDGPGYAGRLMVVVFRGSPAFYEVYSWRRCGCLKHHYSDYR